MTRIETLRKILADKQACKVDGILVDTFTANVIVQIYDSAGAFVQGVIETAPIERVAAIALGVGK